MAVAASLQISINQEDCIGCSACVAEAPETFDMDDDNKAFVKDTPHDELEFVMAAAEACPIDAISVVDPEGQTLYPEA